MELPSEITFTIDQEVVPAMLMAAILGQPVSPDDLKNQAPEVFGAEYAGAIVVRYPTIRDTVALGCRTPAEIEAYEVRDPGGVSLVTYQLVQALVFFATLGVKRPAWLDEHVASTPKTLAAIIHAHHVARAKLEEGKKKPDSTGATSSPPS